MNKFSSEDLIFMRRALKLARRGRFTASPNPCVGCVIVRNGVIISEGWHKKAGTDHAEAAALRNIGGRAEGATVYVTLEPCSHYGRTPPCAKALVKAGVRRVVAAVTDINPKVSGRGMQILADAGIKAEVGLCAAEALELNRAFFKAMRTGLPYVTVKTAYSLDGRIALPSGESKWITGPRAREDVQRLRALSDAVITGVNTVLADDPKLSVRYAELPLKVRRLVPQDQLRQPLKVVLDSKRRLTPEICRTLNLFKEGQVLQVCTAEAAAAQVERLSDAHQILWVPADGQGRCDLTAVLKYLGGLELRRVLVEAGSGVTSAFLNADLCDELYCYQAPLLLGADSRSALQLNVPASIAQAQRFTLKSVKRIGPDLRLHYEKQPADRAVQED